MNAGALIALLRSDPSARSSFLGIAWSDSDFKIEKFPSSVILNTDKYRGPGIHWCAVHFESPDKCEYFDPFGLPPVVAGSHDFSKILLKNAKHVDFNGEQVQDFHASTCGHHCAYFILLRSRNISLDTILEDFYTDNIQLNDEQVRNYVNSQLKNWNLR